MSVIDRTVIVPYTAKQMFALVNDIASYKTFVPYCSDSVIVERTESEIVATLTLSAALITKSFTSRNILSENRMDIGLINGPFKTLAGYWLFNDLEAGQSEVKLHLSFEIEGILLRNLFTPVFSEVANSLVGAFVTHAEKIYAKKENAVDHGCICVVPETN